MMKLSDFVFKYLHDYGIKDAFMLSGGGCMHLCDSIGKSKINYICCLHEQAVAISALAYAQYNNDLGVALVTTGPGGTNAVTGVAGAWAESVPLLVISGQVKTADIAGESGIRMLGFQEVPIVDIVKPITKYAVTVMEANEIKYHLEKAIYEAKTGRRGPVWLDIPLDIQMAIVDETSLKGFVPQNNNKNLDENVMDKIIEMITKAQRPTIIAGCGIRLAGAVDEFNAMVDMLNIPVMTTWKAADIIPFDHPMFFGRPGTAGQRPANFIQQNCDLLISIGARLDFGQIGYDHTTFAREAKKIVVDVDGKELKKFKFGVDVALEADAGELIKAILRRNVSKKDIGAWIECCVSWKNKYPIVLPEHREKQEYVSMYALSEELSNQMTADDIFVPGSSGMCSDVPMQVIDFKKGQRSLNSPGLGAMGYGVPSTIGACVASGRNRTICTNGDGGFQMNIQELETIKRLNLPIKFFVFNNDGYGSIKITQRNYFNGDYVGSNPESGVTLPNSVKIANAYGIKAFRLQDSNQIKQVVKEVLTCEGPAICEVIVDPMEVTMYKASNHIKPDGKAVARPLEDLAPFLPREEFYNNMIIKPIEE